MGDLNTQYEQLKKKYRGIFIEAAETIRQELDKLKPDVSCKSCTLKDCSVQTPDIFSEFPLKCPYHEWQLQALTYLSGDYRQKMKHIYKKIMEAREFYECSKCGACCKLAVSEFSYLQLKQKAMRGDKFAKEFVSIFVPYESEDQARAVLPEYFNLLDSLELDTKNYYYHCPKVVDNMCSDYENRPDICKEFPANPLKLLPASCGYCKWREDVNKLALSLQARLDIMDFYKQKLG